MHFTTARLALLLVPGPTTAALESQRLLPNSGGTNVYRYTVPFGLGILMVGAMVAYLLTARVPVSGASSPPQVSPFDLMLKAKDLPVESFDAI